MMGREQVERLIRMRELTELVGLGRSTIYREISKGRFPEPVHPFGLRQGEARTDKRRPKVGRMAVLTAWRAADVQAWIADRIARRAA